MRIVDPSVVVSPHLMLAAMLERVLPVLKHGPRSLLLA